jgi:hypothetical protein
MDIHPRVPGNAIVRSFPEGVDAWDELFEVLAKPVEDGYHRARQFRDRMKLYGSAVTTGYLNRGACGWRSCEALPVPNGRRTAAVIR